MTPGVLILAGPTASGKTVLAVELAKRFDAEIVGADSRQIYRGMPVGTAAPSADELRAVPHHLIGFLDPQERYSAGAFVRDALAAIDTIHARGKRAIVAGGTGFYIRALSGDVGLAGERDETMRARLAREALLHPPEVMHEWLAALDAHRAAALHPGDRYRVMRALEVALAQRAGSTPAADISRETLRTRGIPFVKAYLDVPFAELEPRIAERVDRMIRAGLVEEAEGLGTSAVAADAVGYPQALAYVRGFSSPSELHAQLVRATRRYAKRQAAWFRSEPGVTRIAGNLPEGLAAVARTIPGWA
ncbi:MAG: tRNA (adenosine(37)-N6)-dimethylallyltransferase MiaA [Vulcanimicrobiaceae bacterium]